MEANSGQEEGGGGNQSNGAGGDQTKERESGDDRSIFVGCVY